MQTVRARLLVSQMAEINAQSDKQAHKETKKQEENRENEQTESKRRKKERKQTKQTNKTNKTNKLSFKMSLKVNNPLLLNQLQMKMQQYAWNKQQ